MKRIALGLLALALALPANAEPVKLRISWSTTPSHITPLLPEIPKAVYKHWGQSYVVEPVFMQGTSAMLPALASEDAQLVGYSYQTHASAVLTGGLDVRAVGGVLGSKPPYSDEAFWVKKSSKLVFFSSSASNVSWLCPVSQRKISSTSALVRPFLSALVI